VVTSDGITGFLPSEEPEAGSCPFVSEQGWYYAEVDNGDNGFDF
jgi:hypothetical protein